MQRKKAKRFFNTGKAFQYLSTIIVPKLNIEDYFGIKTLSVDSAEADDILMCLIRRMKHPHNVIIATDHDYIQILDKCRMFDLSGKEINREYISEKIAGDDSLSVSDYLKIKIIMGDKSDNIPSIFDRCGPKTGYKLVKNPTLLREKLQENPSSVKQLQLNKALIDATRIPVELQKKIIMEYQNVKRDG
jgi:5'-3' exonuclease